MAFFLSSCTTDLPVSSDKASSGLIVLITADALRQDHIGFYGYPRNTTPNIDKIGEISYVFTDSVSQVPFTRSAAYSIMTGKYPPSVEDMGKYYYNIVTLPLALRSGGYKNLAVIGTDVIGSKTFFNKDFDEFLDVISLPTYDDFATLNASVVVDAAISLINISDEDKIFLWLHFKDPHIRYSPSQQFKYTFQSEPETYLEVNEFWADGYKGIPRYNYLENRTDLEYYIDRYDEEILTLDHSLGSFFEFLNDTDKFDSSMIIIAGLHGENLGENDLYFTHSFSLDNANIRTPLMIKYPFQDETVGVSEMIPISAIYEIVIDAAINNKTFFPQTKYPVLLLENLPLRVEEHPEFEDIYPKQYGIRTKNLKLIMYEDNKELYSVSSDIQDTDELDYEIKSNSLFAYLQKEYLVYKLEKLKKEVYSKSYESEYMDIDSIGISGRFFEEFSLEKNKIGDSIVSYRGEKGNLILRIRQHMGLEDFQIEKEISSQIAILNAMYEERESPYPGVISSRVGCDESMSPIIDLGSGMYKLYSTSTLAYGVCSQELAGKKSLLHFLRCDDGSFYRIELFFPLDEDYEYYISRLEEISCD